MMLHAIQLVRITFGPCCELRLKWARLVIQADRVRRRRGRRRHHSSRAR
jgi:hypothetical protein